MFEWKSQRSGMMSSAIATAGAFLRSAPELALPDLQLVFLMGMVDDHARKFHLGHGMSCHGDVLRPFSRGMIGEKAADLIRSTHSRTHS